MTSRVHCSHEVDIATYHAETEVPNQTSIRPTGIILGISGMDVLEMMQPPNASYVVRRLPSPSSAGHGAVDMGK